MNADQIEELAEKMLTLATILDDIACDVRAMCPGLDGVEDALKRTWGAEDAPVAKPPIKGHGPNGVLTNGEMVGKLWNAGLTTSQIALMCGVNKGSVWNWFHGKPAHAKNSNRLREVCLAHGIDPVRARA
jgi:hypothetical protein